MADFASAALVAAVQRSLAEQGITVVAPSVPGALLPLADKRALLVDVAAVHGLLPLLRVGLSLPHLPPDPALAALMAARSPGDLFARWARLERFVHSRHRVVIRTVGDHHLVAEHVGPVAAPPVPAEDSLVLGVLAALTAELGARDLTVRLGGPDGQMVFDGGTFAEPMPGTTTAVWHFAWSSLVPTVPLPGWAAGDDDAARLRRVIAEDLGHRWTLSALASRLGTSPRSLQRRLRTEGGFAALLGAARADGAGQLLRGTAHPLAVVGFACGYADQPHFTREFKRRTAMTPAAFRAAFTDTSTSEGDHS